MLEKPKFFLNLKEFWLTMLVLTLLLLTRLFFFYEEYEEFKVKPFYYTDVQVIQAYEKWNEDEYHTILKVYAPSLNLSFFSRTKIRAKEVSSSLRLKLFPDERMTFFDYLGTSFMFSSVNEIYDEEKNVKNKALTFVEEQHKENILSSFYKAIYFATPLDRELRTQVSSLGVSHLIALSGFHLAILSTLLFFFLRPLYRVFQKRYFPYRFDLHDVGLLVLVLLAWYVWFVDSPPSLLRSYGMMAVAWLLLVLGMELLSFTFLSSIILILLIIFPKMLVSLAFWFSVVGVFYIFLLLQHFSKLNKYLMTLFISFGIFILMLPIVHMVFPIVNILQLLSPFLSLLFSVFYPISMGLHLVGLGDLFDPILLELFTLQSTETMFTLNIYYGLVYLFLSFLSIFSKKLFYLLFFVALAFSVWLFMGF
ncbi:MAG: Competence protein [uncultured Sulfurovum sp.]|uniref:Competence protein n=1 Tax=uncultured Sulfurovum sp. TaxID=269237 RepID=A0A6S6T0N1_9BACT|nr:MAG: Competence protein [uncultured Sulfurovum sp.]